MVLALFLLSLGVSSRVEAQSTYTSQLTGVVSDPSGAVMPGAKVTLTDEDTNIPANSVTNGSGIYLFTNVRPGTYTIRVEAPGLAPQERKALKLAVSQSATLNFTLSPQAASETVTVTEQAPLLDTGNASLGTDVTNEYVRDIPLSNRSMFGLVFSGGRCNRDGRSGHTGFLSIGHEFCVQWPAQRYGGDPPGRSSYERPGAG